MCSNEVNFLSVQVQICFVSSWNNVSSVEAMATSHVSATDFFPIDRNVKMPYQPTTYFLSYQINVKLMVSSKFGTQSSQACR